VDIKKRLKIRKILCQEKIFHTSEDVDEGIIILERIVISVKFVS